MQRSKHKQLGNTAYAAAMKCKSVTESVELWNDIVRNKTSVLSWAGFEGSKLRDGLKELPVTMYSDAKFCQRVITEYTR